MIKNNNNVWISKVKRFFIDLFFSFFINISYWGLLLFISKVIIRIGGSGDAGMIWVLIMFLIILQFCLSIIILTTFNLFTRKKSKIKHTTIFLLSNAILPFLICLWINEPVFENNNYVLLTIVILLVYVILFHKTSNVEAKKTIST